MQQRVWKLLCFIAALSSVNGGATSGTQLSEEEAAVTQLYGAISRIDQQKNAVFSPVSIGMALKMLHIGASGKTSEEIGRIMFGNASTADIGNVTQATGSQLTSQSDTQLNIISSLYHQEGITMKQSYLSSIRQEQPGALIEKCNFQGDSEGCRRRINERIGQATAQKIPELLKQGLIGPDTVVVLTSAIYFKARWPEKFIPVPFNASTPFYRFGRESDRQNVTYFHGKRWCHYSESEKAVTVGIPYKGDEHAFCVVLPKKRDGLAEVENEVIKHCLDVIRSQTVEVVLDIPKFTIKQNVDLKGVLMSLGARTMFTNAANFEGMTNSNIVISDAVHEAFISVDEHGTEAAAATGIVSVATSAIIGPPPKKLFADHPFFYAIVAKKQPNVLFAGKVLYVE